MYFSIEFALVNRDIRNWVLCSFAYVNKNMLVRGSLAIANTYHQQTIYVTVAASAAADVVVDEIQ